MEIAYIAVVKSFNIPNPYLLLLANSFNFNLSFLILPDVISNNIPIPSCGKKRFLIGAYLAVLIHLAHLS